MGKSENTTLETFDSGRVDTGRFREAAPGKGRNNNNNKRRQQQTDLHPSPLININAGSTPLPAVQQTGGVPAQETPDVVRFREPSFAEHIWPPVDAFAEPMPDSAVPAKISRDQSADASLGDEFTSPAKVSPLQRLSPSLTDDDFEAVEDGRRTGTLVATALGLSLITLAVGSEVSERLSRWYNPPNPHAIDARHMMDSAISAADAVKRTVKEGVHDFADSARQAAHEARDQAHARPRQWMKRGAEFAERKARHARHEFVEKAKRGIRQGIDEAQPKLKQSDMSGRELRLESEERGRPHVMGQIGKNADRLDREPYKLHPSPDEIRRESEGRGRVGKHADRLDRGAYKARESLDAMRDRARGMFHDVKDTFKEGVHDLREDAESIIEQPQSFLGRIRQMFSTEAIERRTAKRHHREHDFEEDFDQAKHYAESKMHDVKQRVESKVRGADSKLHEGQQRVESKVRGAQRQVEHTMRHGLDSTLDNARASVNEVALGAREVAGDIREQVGEAAGVIHDFGESFVEQLGSVGESAGEFVEDIAGHVRYEASIAMDQLKGKLAKAEPQGWFGSLLNRFTGTRNAKATESAEIQAEESPLIPEREALDDETPEPIAGRHHGKFTRADDAAKPPKHTPVKPAPRDESQDAASELGHRLYSAASQAKAGMKEEANHFLDTWRRIVLGPDTPRWQVHHPQEEATESFKEENEPASFTESVRDGVQHVREAFLGTPNPEDVLGTRAFEQAQRQRPPREAAREAVHDVRDKVRGAAHEAADEVRGAVRGNIRGAASQVRGAAEKVYDDARRRAHELRDDVEETEHEILHGSISLAQSIRSHLDALAKYFSGELEPVCKPKASDAWKEQLARQHGSHTAADLTEQLKRNKESTIPKEEFVPAAKKKDVL